MKQFADRAFLALLLAVLLAVPLGVALWSHKETTAYYENRSLAEAPELTAESVWDGSFGTEAESWYSDHAPGRTTLLELDTWVQMKLMGRPVVNGIVTVGDVLLPELEFDEYSEEAYRYGAAPIAEDFLNNGCTLRTSSPIISTTTARKRPRPTRSLPRPWRSRAWIS